jgi:hypothetical protein
MKKLLFLVMLTSMFGTAHATRSRMNSLGQDPNQGSFYLMDNRDFFRNPANAGKMRNFMVAELGQNYAETANTTPTVANFEGGYFGEFNSDMAFGVYLGKQNVLSDVVTNAIDENVAANPTPTNNGSFLGSQDANPVNLFLGGGSDMKWGIDLNFAMTSEDRTAGEAKYNAFGLALGIETSGGLQVYASYNDSKSESGGTGANELKNNGYQIGIIWGLNAETTIFGQYTGGTSELNVAGGKADVTQFILGIGRIYELSPTARFNFDLSYNSGEYDPDGNMKWSQSALPLVMGLEADAAEWLILRTSIRQNFILGEYTKDNGTKKESSNTALTGTRVALGATLHFGKLKIDGNLGGVGGVSQTSLFDSSNFFVNAAATYMF